MLTSRKALLSNLNYIHLQQVTLGVHLSMQHEMMEGPRGQEETTAHRHQCKDAQDTVLVDANSNDPSVPCQCCAQHSSHVEAMKSKEYLEAIQTENLEAMKSMENLQAVKFNENLEVMKSNENLQTMKSMENLEVIMCEDYLSPDQPPLSPFSPSSPSTDSSSSSDFTLDDSPVSLYYKEYAEDETPDQQPDIIPLDVEALPSLVDSIDPSHPTVNETEDTIHHHDLDPEDVPFIDWSSDTSDSDTQQAPPLRSTSVDPQEREDVANANQTDATLGSPYGDPAPRLLVPESSSTQTSKKTITSFHELAQRRRRSGGAPQLKKDKSDWLIVFSPDVEQPPVNELTASAFYNGLVRPQTQLVPQGKEITTFKELRYRNSINKGRAQSAGGPQESAEGPPNTGSEQLTQGEHNSHYSPDTENLQDSMREAKEREPQQSHSGPETGVQKVGIKLETPHRQWAENGLPSPILLASLPAVTTGNQGPANPTNTYGRKEAASSKVRRGMADGGDRRGREVFAALPPSRLLLRLSTNLTPPPSVLPHGVTLEVPGCFVLPPQSWYPRLPVRLSPLGASSPPQRALRPPLDTPDVAVLLSPLFPRTRSRELGPLGAPTADSSDTGGAAEPLMADGGGASDKKGLLVAVESAVGGIIAHFNSSRNQVQKAQLGDSRLSPKLGHLILNSLSPSLFSLIGDGLKPFQKDVIIGRRRLSPWTLVEASSKAGPGSLHILFCNVSRLQPLRDPQRRFNAFIFGLLNTKQLDVWISLLHHMYDQLSLFFLPSGFLPLASTSCPELREELLLILQPLSALTFYTDLLFEHHHLPLQDPPTPQGPPCQSEAERRGLPPLQQILDLGGWLTQSLTGNTDREEGGQTLNSRSDLQPRREADLSRDRPPGARTASDKESLQGAASTTKDWWGQLGRASGLYRPPKKDRYGRLGEAPDNKEQFTSTAAGDGGPPPRGSVTTDPGPGLQKGGWLGQLFGAQSRDCKARPRKSRRPSSWLPPNVNVLSLIRLLSTPEEQAAAPAEPEEGPGSERRQERSLRALCDHAASTEAQLSFHKGDVLQLLGTVDEDWIRCRRGSDTGLVPVGYTSLIM